MTATSIEYGFKLCYLFATISVAFRFYRSKVYRSFPFLSAFLFLAIPDSILAVLPGTRSSVYYCSYVISGTVFAVVYLLMVWELCSHVFRGYKGARSASWLIGTTAAAAVSISLIAYLLASPPPRHYRFLSLFTRTEGAQALALFIFILVVLFFARRYSLTLSPRIVKYGIIMSVYFLVNAAVLLFWSGLPRRYTFLANEVMLLVESGCYLLWARLLCARASGSSTSVSSAPPSQPRRLPVSKALPQTVPSLQSQ